MGVMVSSVSAAVVLGAIVLRAETKMAPTTTSMVMMNKMRHGAPSTLASDPCPIEGKGKGVVNEGKGGGHLCGRWW